MPTLDEKETAIQLDNNFQSSLDHPSWRDWRKHFIQNNEYVEGKQWTNAELEVLKERNQPPTVNNQIKVTVDRLVGQVITTRTKIGFRGRNLKDGPAGDVLSDIFLYIAQQNGLKYEKKDRAFDGIVSGMGCLETGVSFNDLNNPDITIEAISSDTVYPDPFSRKYDWNKDAKFVCTAKWIELKEAQELYPQFLKKLRSLVNAASTPPDDTSGTQSFKNDTYVDFKYERVRIVQCWYKVKKREAILVKRDGNSIDATNMSKKEINSVIADLDANLIERVKSKMRVGTFISSFLLEDKESPFTHGLYPIIPYFVARKKNGQPYSLIEIAIPIQDAINKRESKAMHLLNVNQSVYEEGAIDDKNELAIQKAKPDGQIIVNRGYFDKFKIEKNVDLASTQMAFHQMSQADYRIVTGINPDSLGEKSEVRSGVGIARKQQMTNIIITDIFDNLDRSDEILAKTVEGLVRQYMTKPQILNITDNLKKTKAINLDENAIEAIKQGTFDVVVEKLPDTTTMQQEQLNLLLPVLPNILALGPAWTRIVLQMMDIRDKEEILAQVDQAMNAEPPTPKPKMNISVNWSELTAMEKSVFGKPIDPKLAEIALLEDKKAAHTERNEVERDRIRADVAKKSADIDAGDRDRLQKSRSESSRK